MNCSFDVLRRRPKAGEENEVPGQEAWEQLLELSAKGPAPDSEALNAEVQRHIHNALTLLTPVERAAFVLRHFEDKSIGEISLALGVKENAAKQSVFRAVQKLRGALAPIVRRQPSQPPNNPSQRA